MIPKKTIEELIIKHANLEKDLSSEKIEKKEFAEKSKEYSNLNTIIDQAKNYLSFEENKTFNKSNVERFINFHKKKLR